MCSQTVSMVVAVVAAVAAVAAAWFAWRSQKIAQEAEHRGATPRLTLDADSGPAWFENLRVTSDVDLDHMTIRLDRDNSNPEETHFVRFGPLFMHSFTATSDGALQLVDVHAGKPYPFRVDRSSKPAATDVGVLRIRCTCRRDGKPPWVVSCSIRREWL